MLDRSFKISTLLLACLLISNAAIAETVILPNVPSAGGITAPSALPCSAENSEIGLKHQEWDDDRSYSLLVDKEDESNAIRRAELVGDYIRVSQEETPSLVASSVDATDSVPHLIFDSRRIDLDGSVALKGATLELGADDLRISAAGRLSLHVSERSPGNRGKLRIVAGKLQLPSEVWLAPIEIYLNAGEVVEITVAALEVWVDGRKLTDREASAAVWRTIAMSDEMEAPPEGVRILVGENAIGEVERFQRESADWPAAVYAKALRHHLRSPHSPKTRSVIDTYAKALIPLAAKAGNEHLVLGWTTLQNHVQANRDAYGRQANWAPRMSLRTQIEELSYTISLLGGASNVESRPGREGIKGIRARDYASNLIEIIADGLNRKKRDPEKLRKLSEEHQSVSNSILILGDKLDAAGIELESFKARGRQITESLAARREELQRMNRREIEKLERAARDRGFITSSAQILGAAGSYFGTPVVGAIAATGVSVLGDFVYAHNVQQNMTPISLAEIIGSSIAFYSSMEGFYSSFREVRSAWREYKNAPNEPQASTSDAIAGNERQSRSTDQKEVAEKGSTQKKDKPKTKQEALASIGQGFNDMATGLKGALEAHRPRELTQRLKFEDKEERDPQIGDLLYELSVIQHHEDRILQKIGDLQARFNKAVEEELQRSKTLDDLRALDPVNDRDHNMWAERARFMWHQLLSKAVGDVYLLQRSFYFETGEVLPLGSIEQSILEYPAELQSLVSADLIDVMSPSREQSTADRVRTHLEAQRVRLSTALISTQLLALDALYDWMGRGQPLQKRTYPTAERFSSTSDRQAYRAFIEALNAQIALQVSRRKRALDVGPSKPLFIPYTIPVPQSLEWNPVRLRGIRVLELEWDSKETQLGGSGLTFNIIHPGYGALTSSVSSGSGRPCVNFDLRQPGASNNWVTPISTIMLEYAASNRVPPLQPQVIADGHGSRFYIDPPAITDYFVSVSVDSEQWGRIPQIRAITIEWEVYR